MRKAYLDFGDIEVKRSAFHKSNYPIDINVETEKNSDA